jgi:hypothetical protein
VAARRDEERKVELQAIPCPVCRNATSVPSSGLNTLQRHFTRLEPKSRHHRREPSTEMNANAQKLQRSAETAFYRHDWAKAFPLLEQLATMKALTPRE